MLIEIKDNSGEQDLVKSLVQCAAQSMTKSEVKNECLRLYPVRSSKQVRI